MAYNDFLKETSERNGATKAQRLVDGMQSDWDRYFAETPNRVTIEIDGIEEDVVIQHMRYGEDKYDNQLMLTENSTVANYGSKVLWKSKIWLVINEEKRAIETHKGWKILLTQNNMVSKDSKGNILTEECHIKSTTSRSDGNTNVPLTENSLIARVQKNDVTLTYFTNQRFIFDNKVAYKIVNLNYSEYENQIDITLEPTQILSEDDLVNNIAYNSFDINTIPDTGKTGIYFTKDSLEIQVDSSETVDVYEYLNDVIVPSTVFTFRIDDIDASKYQIITSDDNSITIKALDYYYSGTLVAIDTSDLSEYSIPLTLVSALG